MSTVRDQLTCNTAFAAWLVIFTTSFPFGFNGSILNQPFLIVRQFYNDTYTQRKGLDGKSPTDMKVTILWSITNAIYVVGIMVGYFFASGLMDKLGRKNVILVGQVFLIIGTALAMTCTISKSPEMLMIGRCLMGVLGGIGNGTTPIFLAEISPPRLRGAMGVGHQLALVSGSLVSSVMGLPMVLSTESTWFFLFSTNVLIFIVAVLCLPLIPETPRYLYLVVGDVSQARSALVWYRGRTDVDDDINEMEHERQSHLQEAPFTWRELFGRKLRRPLIIVIMLQINRQSSAMNALVWYSAHVFKGAGLEPQTIPFAVVGLSAASVMANLFAIPLIDRIGRRPLLLSTMSTMVTDLVILMVMISIQSTYHWAAAVSVACVYLHIIMSNTGIGAISWVLGAELFEQRARPRAGLVGGVAYCVMFLLVIFAFEPLYNTIDEYVFVIFAGLLLFFIAFTFFVVPETKNKTFAEIARSMSSRRTSFINA